MAALSIAITGSGRYYWMWPSHAAKRFPNATIYDRSETVTAFRRGEADLGRKGYLRPEDRAWAKRIARNLANPPPVDATLTFSENIVKVKCRNGREKVFRVPMLGISDAIVAKMFAEVDAAIEACKHPRPQS